MSPNEGAAAQRSRRSKEHSAKELALKAASSVARMIGRLSARPLYTVVDGDPPAAHNGCDSTNAPMCNSNLPASIGGETPDRFEVFRRRVAIIRCWRASSST
jgi:hypothetical protein